MRFFDKNKDKKESFFIDDLEDALRVADDKSPDYYNDMNPFDISKVVDTSDTKYPTAKGDPNDVYNFAYNLDNSLNLIKVETTINNGTYTETSTSSSKCCIIL